MSWRIIARRTGGPEVMEREDFDPGAPGPGEALVRHEAVGLNYVDTYFRSGLYPSGDPITLGCEAAGTVEAVGAGVESVKAGDRVAYATMATGAYATHRRVAAAALVKLPDDIGFDVAAAVLLKGITAAGMAGPCARAQPGQWVLVHAAAGGVGSLLVPWLADMGVNVIAHAGTAEKARLAKAAGAAHALYGPLETLAAEVRALTGGAGADTVFDGIGAAGWKPSIASLKRRGLMISYGNASGPVPPISLLELAQGSLFVTRYSMYDYIADPQEYRGLTDAIFDRLRRGIIHAGINQRFALADVADAHRALEGRQTTGATVLIP